MARGIIIFGPADSGKTTLGKMTADELEFPYFDLDDYIWRKDTEIPFSVMYSREQKISRLMTDISAGDHFVMAGSFILRLIRCLIWPYTSQPPLQRGFQESIKENAGFMGAEFSRAATCMKGTGVFWKLPLNTMKAAHLV